MKPYSESYRSPCRNCCGFAVGGLPSTRTLGSLRRNQRRRSRRPLKKSVRQAAKREIQQETIIPVDLIPLFDIIDDWGL